MASIEERIAEQVEARGDRIVETLSALVSFPSIVMSDPTKAGPGERDCQLYLQGRLEKLGFTTDLWVRTVQRFMRSIREGPAPTRAAPSKAGPISAEH